MNATRPASRKLIVISAPSGAGKTTLCSRLLRDFAELTLSISTTTRAPRGEEKHGVAYFFVSRQEFEQGIQAGEFAEWALVHGNYYGTSRKTLEDSFRAGRAVLLDIDVQGAASLRQAFPAETCTIFISPPDLETLETRLRARGTDSEESIARRMANSRQEMAEASRFDTVIVNDELEKAYAALQSRVAKALGRDPGGRT